MPIGEIGAFLLFLVIVFIVGNLWFHFVEAILRQIKKLFTRHKKNLRHGIRSPRTRRIENVRYRRDYLFGGLMWKLLCGDSSAGSYLGYLADAATDLLTGKAEQDNGQWRDCPWPAQRKIGFTL